MTDHEQKVRATVDVPADHQGNYLDRDVAAGEEFFVFKGHTYGCIDHRVGIAVSETGSFEYPFAEFPNELLEDV